MEGQMMKNLTKLGGWLGVILLVAGLVIYSLTAIMTWMVYLPLILGALLVITSIVFHLGEIKKGLTSRSAKFGSNAMMMVLVIFGILVVANILANRFSWRIDTTAAKQFSLADQTRNLLKNLDQDVKVTGFFKSGDEAFARELITEYAHYSDRLKFDFVDPDKKPGVAKKYQIKAYGTLVIEGNGKEERIEKTEEQLLTNAIIKVTREGKKKLYFTSGHGEKDPDKEDPAAGLSTARTALTNENYDIATIVLAQENAIPEECSLLVIAGPRSDLFGNEQTLIGEYLKKGGKLLALLDPETPESYIRLLAEWGFEIGHDVVVDASGFGQLFGAGPTMPIVSQYQEHAITKDFNLMTFFPEARSIKQSANLPAGLTFQEIGKTSQRSWGETSPLSGAKQIAFDPGSDLRGPITLCASAEMSSTTTAPGEGKTSKTRLVVFGDSDFASNAYFNTQGNGNLFLNAVSWLAEEEDLISVRARDPEDRRIAITQTQSRGLLYIGVILLPLVIFATGIAVYRKRK
jgi:ABC-type uncharacterized transport system involved in gliding motility auxiliary subunit